MNNLYYSPLQSDSDDDEPAKKKPQTQVQFLPLYNCITS